MQYIYEYGADSYPSPDQAVRYQPGPLGLQPPTEAITLADYRARHALYRQGAGGVGGGLRPLRHAGHASHVMSRWHPRSDRLVQAWPAGLGCKSTIRLCHLVRHLWLR